MDIVPHPGAASDEVPKKTQSWVAGILKKGLRPASSSSLVPLGSKRLTRSSTVGVAWDLRKGASQRKATASPRRRFSLHVKALTRSADSHVALTPAVLAAQQPPERDQEDRIGIAESSAAPPGVVPEPLPPDREVKLPSTSPQSSVRRTSLPSVPSHVGLVIGEDRAASLGLQCVDHADTPRPKNGKARGTTTVRRAMSMNNMGDRATALAEAGEDTWSRLQQARRKLLGRQRKTVTIQKDTPDNARSVCPKCNGKKQVKRMGILRRTCPHCYGMGWNARSSRRTSQACSDHSSGSKDNQPLTAQRRISRSGVSESSVGSNVCRSSDAFLKKITNSGKLNDVPVMAFIQQPSTVFVNLSVFKAKHGQDGAQVPAKFELENLADELDYFDDDHYLPVHKCMLHKISFAHSVFLGLAIYGTEEEQLQFATLAATLRNNRFASNIAQHAVIATFPSDDMDMFGGSGQAREVPAYAYACAPVLHGLSTRESWICNVPPWFDMYHSLEYLVEMLGHDVPQPAAPLDAKQRRPELVVTPEQIAKDTISRQKKLDVWIRQQNLMFRGPGLVATVLKKGGRTMKRHHSQCAGDQGDGEKTPRRHSVMGHESFSGRRPESGCTSPPTRNRSMSGTPSRVHTCSLVDARPLAKCVSLPQTPE